MAKIDLIDAQIEDARRAGQKSLEDEPHAKRAWYESDKDLIWIETTLGAYHGVPVEILQGLQKATPDQLADIELSPQGVGLHWPQLDADLTVAGIIFGIYGTRSWMAGLGRKGGKCKTPRKAAASRVNGKKGGRPRKKPLTVGMLATE